jgi:hypothetical protein
MPESNNTVRRPPTASTIGGRASSDPIAPSTWRPPWLETTMPSIRCFTASFASCTAWIPFSKIGPSQLRRINGNCSQLRPGFWNNNAKATPAATGSSSAGTLRRRWNTGSEV